MHRERGKVQNNSKYSWSTGKGRKEKPVLHPATATKQYKF